MAPYLVKRGLIEGREELSWRWVHARSCGCFFLEGFAEAQEVGLVQLRLGFRGLGV